MLTDGIRRHRTKYVAVRAIWNLDLWTPGEYVSVIVNLQSVLVRIPDILENKKKNFAHYHVNKIVTIRHTLPEK